MSLRTPTRPSSSTSQPHSKLRIGDVARVGSSGLRSRKLRAALSALGIAIGIAAMVGVLGLSESSKSDLLAELDALGTNLLTVQASTGFGAGDAALPDDSAEMIARIPTVEATAAVSPIDVNVYRSEFVPSGETGGITVVAADSNLLETLNGAVAEGVFLDEANSDYPVAVLGSVAAERLGVSDLDIDVLVYIGDEYVEVVGILSEFPLAPDLDRTVMISEGAAEAYFQEDIVPTTIYVRVDPDVLDETRALLGATADPQNPEEVEVSRPSDVIEAQAAAESAFDSLFLGLGAVALLVGGVGIANVMVIAVIERRSEIGLRRAIGATKSHIRSQFLTEALILAALGGIAGVVIGVGVTAAYASSQGWAIIIPPEAMIGGFVAAVVIGAIAGLYPAMRAANLPPTEALRAAG